MKNNELLGDFEREMIEERIGKLKGGLCLVKAGGLQEAEVKECRDRIEDALFAVKAAIQEGYVIGGGFALLQACQNLNPDETCENEWQRTGFNIIQKACEEPAR